jgi:anti-sigma-K factor RskA
MNASPELIERLAAEYVLGTLRGGARRRFERWRGDSPQIETRCRWWEDQLMGLARNVPPVQPPARVWSGIEQRLALERAPRARWTRQLAIAAGIVLVAALAALWYWPGGPFARPNAVASIAPAGGSTVWQVEVFARAGRLVARAERAPPVAVGRDYELWALPAVGSPVSLGLLPRSGEVRRVLSARQQQALTGSMRVAVSIEPVGGSPTGLPTGTIAFVAPLNAQS